MLILHKKQWGKHEGSPVTLIDQYYVTLAKSMGFTLEIANTDSSTVSSIMIRHQCSGANVVLNHLKVEELLDFLNVCRLETENKTLEDRVAKLENAVFNQAKENSVSSNAEPNLKEMKIRAQVIGTEISGNIGDSRYHYHRPRFLIPGTRYQFYFTMDNAFNPKQEHYSGPIFIFGKSDLPLLGKWLEHDE